MKHLLLLLFYLCLFSALFPAYIVVAQVNKMAIPDAQSYNFKPSTTSLLFTENQGQVADAQGNPQPEILFTAHGNGVKLFLTAAGIYYQFEKNIFPTGYERGVQKVKGKKIQDALRKQIKTETYRFSVLLQDANPAPNVRKELQSNYTENFYLAHYPNGITGVHTYSRIVMEEVYPGIDWVIYSKGAGLEYDFVVRPGADPSLIQLKTIDAQAVRIDKDGTLIMTTALGEIKEKAPISYCEGTKVSTAFEKSKAGTISFTIAAWDRSKSLTIDPSVTWATYYGNSNFEDGVSCVTDVSGNIYLCGATGSTSGIASGGFQNIPGGNRDAYLVKFSSSGVRLWATYYGGSSSDEGNACVVDASGNVYLAGLTYSTSGITSGGFQNTFGGGDLDAFLVKFNSSGARLWATYYGGNSNDEGTYCAVDQSGNIYLSGSGSSTSGIAFNGFQNMLGGSLDAFLVKFSSSGARIWATYYGGNFNDEGNACTVDATGNVYLTGNARSTSGIASGGFQNTYGGGIEDAFLVKFTSSGIRLWATYYGSSDDDDSYACTTDVMGNIYISGATASVSGIASGGFQNVYGGALDAFLVKFNSNGVRLWATYYGGSFYDFGWFCSTDGAGNVYLAGFTASTTNITSGGFQNNFGGYQDAYLVKFSSNGVRLWATYYGGNDYDYGYACATDLSGNVYLAGNTLSATGIASNGFQSVYNGNQDAFLVKINGDNPVPIKLLSFEVHKAGVGRNRIEWQTLIETKDVMFTVERSAGGRRFVAIATIAGKNENGASYNIFDNSPSTPLSYYRLMMVERDGTISYSAVVAVRSDGKGMVMAGPVPTKTGIMITNTNALLNGTKAIITDLHGREVHRFTITGASFINVSNWAAGIYHLRLNDGSVIPLMRE